MGHSRGGKNRAKSMNDHSDQVSRAFAPWLLSERPQRRKYYWTTGLRDVIERLTNVSKKRTCCDIFGCNVSAPAPGVKMRSILRKIGELPNFTFAQRHNTDAPPAPQTTKWHCSCQWSTLQLPLVNGAQCSTLLESEKYNGLSTRVLLLHTQLGVQRVTSLGGGWVGRRNDNMKGCLPKGKCTLVCSHCATGPEQGDAGSHIHLPPTALYNINLPPWKQLAQQAHYYSIPIVWRNVVIRGAGGSNRLLGRNCKSRSLLTCEIQSGAHNW